MNGPRDANPPLIAVSRCLLGEAVRYDGRHKAFAPLAGPPLSQFRILPLCPEVEAGLAVPRPAMQLVRVGTEVRLRQVASPHVDVTAAMGRLVQAREAALNMISGAILKSRSPSCGIRNVPVFDEAGGELERGAGLFAGRLSALRPGLPLVEETQLATAEERDDFAARVFAYAGSVTVSSAD